MLSELRTMWEVLKHTFTKAETVEYPEQMPYLAPRYRGRIVLTRDPDGEERCVACNLCAAACPVDCIALQKDTREDGTWYPEFFRINFSHRPCFGDRIHTFRNLALIESHRLDRPLHTFRT